MKSLNNSEKTFEETTLINDNESKNEQAFFMAFNDKSNSSIVLNFSSIQMIPSNQNKNVIIFSLHDLIERSSSLSTVRVHSRLQNSRIKITTENEIRNILQIFMSSFDLEALQSSIIDRNQLHLALDIKNSLSIKVQIILNSSFIRNSSPSNNCTVPDLCFINSLNTLYQTIFFSRDHVQATAHEIYSIIDNNHSLISYIEQEQLLSIPDLIPTLRPYQAAALQWMINREICSESTKRSNDRELWKMLWYLIGPNNSAVPLYQVEDGDIILNNAILFNPSTGWLVDNMKDAMESTVESTNSSLIRGGILADSMGLGKTVEVLALLLHNSYPRTINKTLEWNDYIVPNTTKTVKIKVSNQIEATLEYEPYYRNSSGSNSIHKLCICGHAHEFQNCLGWVQCESCSEYLHGKCAGFTSVEEVKSLYKNQCSQYRCQSCVAKYFETHDLIPSRATLIITPCSILEQWQNEIKKHVKLGKWKVLVYPGIKDMCHARKKPDLTLSHVKNLADADIILTTFQVLMDDFHHTSNENPYANVDKSSNLRKKKKYRVLPSPLPYIKFWRCCLDEAQRVETPTTLAAKMALHINSINKWCISGTPVGKDALSDIYGLLLFLQVQPFCHRKWFQSCFLYTENLQPRLQFLCQDLLWRNTKDNEIVRIQMGIPEQTENKVLLKFSSIETHFYQRQLQETVLAATSVREEYKIKNQEHLSKTLLKLRAACSHPQVGSTGLVRIKNTKSRSKSCHDSKSVASGVLSMDQILDRLIDDAKTKCEEAQRLAILHMNAIASLNRLKLQVKTNKSITAASILETDVQLLQTSNQIYDDALRIANDNASPCEVVGEATVTGCTGFLNNRSIVRNGSTILQWQIKEYSLQNSSRAAKQVWAKFDFEGPSKKISSIKIRVIDKLSNNYLDSAWKVLQPKKCILQVSNLSVGGEFVDACSFELSLKSTEWHELQGFRTNKSKSWRILIESYHNTDKNLETKPTQNHSFVSVEVQLFEPLIGIDNLQNIHILHNNIATMRMISQCEDNDKISDISSYYLEKMKKMKKDLENIEKLYLSSVHMVHRESQRLLKVASNEKKDIEGEIESLLKKQKMRNFDPYGISSWWRDFLSWCNTRQRHETNNNDNFLLSSINEDLINSSDRLRRNNVKELPYCRDIYGVEVALTLRMESHLSVPKSEKLLEKVKNLSENPSASEVLENSICHLCRKDWNQTGPTCRHCILDSELCSFEKNLKDTLVEVILGSLAKSMNDNRWYDYQDSDLLLEMKERSKIFFKWHEARLKELYKAKLAWRTHFELLSDLDELNSCKSSLRLLEEGESFSSLSEIERNNVVIPCDIPVQVMDHEAKQAMAMAQLRRCKETLRFLRNQNEERKSLAQKNDAENICSVCLNGFEGERAVLSCGHYFHYSPCLEALMKKGGGSSIACPMRCKVKTPKDQILIATEKSKTDGSQNKREIKGSWGTKIDRLVNDLMEVIETGEKSIVFSQWDDMLIIIGRALEENFIKFTRPKTKKKIGGDLKHFLSGEISVLLLNVKSGAEGLTLIEANHVFMLEPLLNHGLDAQAINRIHRIGQTSVTYVHRYIIQDTIEVKIDKLRRKRKESKFKFNENSLKSKFVSGGGIDGGLDAHELKEILSIS